MTLLTTTLSLALAVQIRAVTPAVLKDAGIAAAPGKARINGVELPLAVVSGTGSFAALAEKARQAFAGRFTVTVEEGILMVADIRSSQCPRCALPTAANLAEIEAKSFVFTASELPGGGLLAFGSEAGPLFEAARRTPDSLQYDGTAFDREAIAGLALRSASAYEFGRGRTNTVTADAQGAPGEIHALLAAQLGARGFQRLAADGPEAQGPGVLTLWTKAGQTVSIAVTAGDSGQTSKVMIHEVSLR